VLLRARGTPLGYDLLSPLPAGVLHSSTKQGALTRNAQICKQQIRSCSNSQHKLGVHSELQMALTAAASNAYGVCAFQRCCAQYSSGGLATLLIELCCMLYISLPHASTAVSQHMYNGSSVGPRFVTACSTTPGGQRP
jgi:hypothetical protein